MKSKFFALAMTLLMVASSAPTLAFEIEHVETGEEISSQTDLSAEKTASEFMADEVVPGKNLLTGTTEPWTFDDVVGKDVSYVSFGEDIVEVITLDDQNNVLKATHNKSVGEAGYHNGIYLWKSETAVNRKLRISFKIKSDVGLATKYGKMLLNPYKDGKFAGSRPNVGEKNESDGWTTFYADTTEAMYDITAIVTHAGHQAAIYVDYYDDISVMPFYKVTYKNTAGDVLKEEYVEPDKSAFTLPSGADFGFTGGAKYIASDNTEYLAGYSYPLAFEDVELTVVDTNLKVLVYEGFDTIGAGHEFNEAGKGFTTTPSYDGLGNVSIVNGDDTDNNSLHITTVDDDGNTVAKITGVSGTYGSVGFKFQHLNFTQPGTYHINVNVKMQSGNLADRIWTQALGSQAPNLEPIRTLPAGVWHTLGWTVDVSQDSSGAYTYTVSNSNGNVNSFEHAAYSDAVWHVYFTPIGSNSVVVYVDDLSITYEAAKTVTAKFAIPGNQQMLTAECFEGKFILPTAEQLGLKYNPAFEINGKDYFPGEVYTVPEDVTAITVHVKETKVILNETFGKRYIHTVPSTNTTAFHEFSYKAPGYDAALTAADGVGNEVFETKTVNGRSVLELADINATQYHSLGIYGITGAKDPGTYVFKLVLKPDGFNGGVVLLDKQGGYGAASGWTDQREPDDDGFITVSFNIELYKKEDGALYIKYSDNNGSYEKAYTDGMLTNMMFYVLTGSTAATIWFDEISVEFTPYAPTTVDKTSYRTDSSNAGIRVAAYVNANQKAACSEYGFIVARKTHLETAAANNGGVYSDYLNLDGVTDEIGTKTTLLRNSNNVLLVAAAGYKGNVDRVYTDDGSVFGTEYAGLSNNVCFYTGILTGIKTVAQQAETYVTRPYIKVNGIYYYGSIKEVSYSNFFPSENA